MSFSVTKSIDKTTLPVKGDAMVTVTLTMASELAANPRDILIAWDYFGEDVDSVYLRDTDGALRGMLESLVGVTGGSNGKLGNGNRVALYGNRANAGEVRTALTDDTAVLLAELDAAKAAPPDRSGPVRRLHGGDAGRRRQPEDRADLRSAEGDRAGDRGAG